MLPLPKWVFAVGFVLVAGLVTSIVVGVRSSGAWQQDAQDWETKYLASEARRADDSLTIERVEAGAATLETDLAAANAMNGRLAAEGARLRRERRELVVSSVPGLPPSVGDTLATCRQGLTLCEREAAVEKLRADSLADVTQGAVMVASSLRGDVEHWKQAYGSLQGLVADARPIIRAADPPCYLAKAGPIRIHCLGRKDGAALAAAGTLLVTSQFAKDADAKRMQRYAAGVLIVGSIVLW